MFRFKKEGITYHVKTTFVFCFFPVVEQLYWEKELHNILSSIDICIVDGQLILCSSVLLTST